MSLILTFEGARSKPACPQKFRMARNDRGLTITQAAVALGVSTAAIESWERGVNPAPSLDTATEAFDQFSAEHCVKSFARNLVFRSYPLRLARELIEMDLEQAALLFDVKPSVWKKYEANVRRMPDALKRDVEDLVRKQLAQVCGF